MTIQPKVTGIISLGLAWDTLGVESVLIFSYVPLIPCSFQVIVNKKPHEHLGVMIVESGWGSMIPCAIIAHLAKDGPAAKSGRLNVGDQILSVNGTSLVGLPLLECQNIIKVSKGSWDIITSGLGPLHTNA